MNIYKFYKHIKVEMQAGSVSSAKIEFPYDISLFVVIFKSCYCVFCGYKTFEYKIRICGT